jgi:probable F420-dependent oxidoreductase
VTVSRTVGVALPYWLDRPDEEAVEIALAADRAGIETVWVGEMATFDAFALATAIGIRTERIGLRIGPLPMSVRSPVAIALGVCTVASLTGRRVDIALGASSPAIVVGWHDRPWDTLAGRMREAILALRPLLNGERASFDGRHVHAHGFKLHQPVPEATITVAAFGPEMVRVAASLADEVVLNLVTPDHVSAVRARLDAHADAAGRPAPRLAVWVPAALDPGKRAFGQLAAQLAVYLAAPGYRELFAGLGFGALVEAALAGTRRLELAAAVPSELLAHVSALGNASEVAGRIGAYHEAGADHVALVPATAEDPAGCRLFAAIARPGVQA